MLNLLSRSEVFIGAIVLLIGYSAYELLVQLELSVAFNVVPLLFALAAAIGLRALNAYGWSYAMRVQGDRVPKDESARIWLIAESRRWLPGGVWGLAARSTMASKLGLSMQRASSSIAIEFSLAIAAVLTLVLPVAIVYREQLLIPTKGLAVTPGRSLLGIALAIAGVGATIVIGYLTQTRIRKRSTATRKQLLVSNVKSAPLALIQAYVFFVALAFFSGVTQWLVCVGYGIHIPVMVVVAVTCIAWLVGLAAVFAPAGMLVREATFALILSAWVPYGEVFLAAITMRGIQVIAELTLLLVAVPNRCRIPAVASSEAKLTQSSG